MVHFATYFSTRVHGVRSKCSRLMSPILLSIDQGGVTSAKWLNDVLMSMLIMARSSHLFGCSVAHVYPLSRVCMDVNPELSLPSWTGCVLTIERYHCNYICSPFSSSARLFRFHPQRVGFTVVNKMKFWLLREQARTGIARFHKPHKYIDTDEEEIDQQLAPPTWNRTNPLDKVTSCTKDRFRLIPPNQVGTCRLPRKQ